MISNLDGAQGVAEVAESPSLKWQYTNNIILFSDDGVTEVQTPHNNAIVISMTITKYDVKRILVDNRSSADVLFYDIF